MKTINKEIDLITREEKFHDYRAALARLYLKNFVTLEEYQKVRARIDKWRTITEVAR